MADISISIDRGGTFCDVIASVKGRDPIIFKLLSDDPANYADAPTEAVRRVLELVGCAPIARGEKLDGSRIGKLVPGSGRYLHHCSAVNDEIQHLAVSGPLLQRMRC